MNNDKKKNKTFIEHTGRKEGRKENNRKKKNTKDKRERERKKKERHGLRHDKGTTHHLNLANTNLCQLIVWTASASALCLIVIRVTRGGKG